MYFNLIQYIFTCKDGRYLDSRMVELPMATGKLSAVGLMILQNRLNCFCYCSNVVLI